MVSALEHCPDMMFWDACEETVLRHNRMHCEHGWDIDLDDGASHYDIHSNLCLRGGLKTREGYRRQVHNNVILWRGYTCNVPYPAPSEDECFANIMWGKAYCASRFELWSGRLDRNLFHDPHRTPAIPAEPVARLSGQDAGSLIGDAMFADPASGDFSVGDDSPARALGFENFPMTGFGVRPPHLRALAARPTIDLPPVAYIDTTPSTGVKAPPRVHGATVETLSSQAQLTVYGVPDVGGAILMDIPGGSVLQAWGFRSEDVVLQVGTHPIRTADDVVQALEDVGGEATRVDLWRDQSPETLFLPADA